MTDSKQRAKCYRLTAAGKKQLLRERDRWSQLVAAIAGLALLATIGNGLEAALRDASQREAALVTFLMTASGVTLWGVGSAFWGLLAGVATLLLLRGGRGG